MKRFSSYLFILLTGISIAFAGNQAGWAAAGSPGSSLSPPPQNLGPFFQKIGGQVAEKAAELVYNYDTRPLIRTVVMDFRDPSGQEVLIGDDLSAYLRSELDRENQFYVYGRGQIQRALGHFIQVNRGMTPYQVSRLQELVPIVFNKPIHLIVAGEIRKTVENQLLVNVMLIPFYQQLTPLGMEAENLAFPQLSFLSPKLTDEEIRQALSKPKTGKGPMANPNYGRLVILSNYILEKPREQERRYVGTLESTLASFEKGQGNSLRQLSLGDPQDLTCWLDQQALFMFEERQMAGFKDYYYNILSGFGADQIWFDAEVKAGEHLLAFSVFPLNPIHKKAVSYPFKVKPGTTTFLVVSVVSQPHKDPEVSIKSIVDPDNKAYPF
jgi:hypothetical protein